MSQFELNKPSETDLAWLAGILDGEGYIAIINANKLIPIVAVRVCDKPIIDDLQRIFPTYCGVDWRYHDGNPNHRPIWMWRVYRHRDVEKLLTWVLPYLRSKRGEAELVLAYVKRRLTMKRPKGVSGGRGPPFYAEDYEFYERLRAEIKRRKTTTVDQAISNVGMKIE